MDGFGRPSAKKLGRQNCKPNPGEGEKREKKSGRWLNLGPFLDAKQVTEYAIYYRLKTAGGPSLIVNPIQLSVVRALDKYFGP